jgi:hypothetical protein
LEKLLVRLKELKSSQKTCRDSSKVVPLAFDLVWWCSQLKSLEDTFCAQCSIPQCNCSESGMDHCLTSLKLGMSSLWWKCCVYNFMDVLRQNPSGHGSLDDVEAYLIEAKCVISSLQTTAPDMNQYWTSYQLGLDHYIDCLEQIREGRTDWSHPEVYEGPDPFRDKDFFDKDPDDPITSIMDNVARLDEIISSYTFNDDSLHSVLNEEALSTSSSPDPLYQAPVSNAISKLISTVLNGWSVFGQAMPTMFVTFDYYYQMHKVLSWTGLPEAGQRIVSWLSKATTLF